MNEIDVINQCAYGRIYKIHIGRYKISNYASTVYIPSTTVMKK